MQFVTIILAAVVAVGSGLAAPLGYDFSRDLSEPRRLDDITVSLPLIPARKKPAITAQD